MKFDFVDVIKEAPKGLMYFIIGVLSGAFFSIATFIINKDFIETLLDMWSSRLLFGIELVGENWYSLWFIANNLLVMIVVIAASVFILVQISRRPPKVSKRLKKFRDIEKKYPEITVAGLYIVPIGALIINGFIISMFATYVYLNYGITSFINAVMLMIPHGINEIVALVLACSLGMSYLKIMRPYIMKKNQKKAISIGKELLFSRTSLYMFVLIIILIVFSGLLEGMMSTIV